MSDRFLISTTLLSHKALATVPVVYKGEHGPVKQQKSCTLSVELRYRKGHSSAAIGIMSRGRNWVFTLNNPDPTDEKTVLSDEQVRYVIVGREVAPGTGTPHLQGFIVFQNAMRLSSVRALLPRAHWEQARGTVDENIRYCSKDGDFEEHGQRPACRGAAEKRRWEDAWSSAKAGRVEEIPADIRFKSYRTIKEIGKDFMVKPADLPVNEALDFVNVWAYGAPGTGKSFTARRENPSVYLKGMNKWWDGYQGEDAVLIDDFEKDAKGLGHHLKIWADAYAFTAEVKGSAMCIRPKKIIVTSNYSIEEVFGDDYQMMMAVKRRFKQVHYSVPYMFQPAVEEVFDPLLDFSPLNLPDVIDLTQ